MYNVKQLGQVFTPQNIVSQMLLLCRNNGRVLEPSCGDGAFSDNIPSCVSIEIDSKYCKHDTLNMDFFDYPIQEKFDTIIGNPPYVRFQDILPQTKEKLYSNLFDERSNLYLFFIEKCINHLNDKGELIFITPRDFLKATSSIKLNKFIYDNGTITDLIDLGDDNIFSGYSPNCIIFRFEKGNFCRRTNISKEFVFCNGQLLFTNNDYPLMFNDLFFVKVGAVSGYDSIFISKDYGNMDFVYSETFKNSSTRRMIFNVKNQYIEQFKDKLIKRKIKKFNENNWWQWGRIHYISSEKRIYVNSKTRNEHPFFTYPCNNYDGSILAIFPKNQQLNIEELKNELNRVNWYELGFMCDGRYLFSQRSLENCPLPSSFSKYVIQQSLF
ncbi:MAG: class I SAM-dependent methyltransferase [Bacteroidales bacterium]|jgi:adenine-specific DNA-methyltransferase|nr:class I SAM-dependent methyltransferase [Bacteroidales bacterium]